MGAKQSRKKLQRQLIEQQKEVTLLRQQLDLQRQLNDQQKEVALLREQQKEQKDVAPLQEQLDRVMVILADLRQKEPNHSEGTQLTVTTPKKHPADDSNEHDVISGEEKPEPVTNNNGQGSHDDTSNGEGRRGPGATTDQLGSQALLNRATLSDRVAHNRGLHDMQLSLPKQQATTTPCAAARGRQATTTPWAVRYNQPVNPGRFLNQPVRGSHGQAMRPRPDVSTLLERLNQSYSTLFTQYCTGG